MLSYDLGWLAIAIHLPSSFLLSAYPSTPHNNNLDTRNNLDTYCTVTVTTRHDTLWSVVRRRRVNDKVSYAHLCSFPLLIAYWV
jgi:hypothetical protein